MLWIIGAALTAITAITIALPLLRKRQQEPAAAYDLRVYRDQLAEVDRDLERGVVGADEANRLRAEIGRKVIDANRRLTLETATSRGHAVVPVVLLGAALVGGVALYAWRGMPQMPDLGLAQRYALAETRYQNRPSQAEAEATAPPVSVAPANPEYEALVEKLRAAVEDRPDDPQGLTLLVQNEARLGNLIEAYKAQEKLIALKGDTATAEDHAALAGLMTEAAGGLITREAEEQLDKALRLDATNRQALYMVGLLQAQNGRPDRAFPIWDQLMREGPPDAPWVQAIRPVIEDLAWLAGHPEYQPPGGAAGGMPSPSMLPGPDSDAIAAANDMTPEERQEMIAGMVANLRERLETEGGTGAEWARLVSSLRIMGDETGAAEAEDRARAALADQADALSAFEAALAGAPTQPAPMTQAPASSAAPMPGPSAAEVEAAADMSPEDRQAMIEGMVRQLETRLATQGGTADEWARLISVLPQVGQRDHARDILDEARSRFADVPDKLKLIEDAAQQAGLE